MRIPPTPARVGALATSLLVAAWPTLGAGQTRTVPVERDSAGVRIVENPSRLRAPVAFALGPTPILDVGGPPATPVTRAQTFDHREGYLRGVRMADGGLAVIDVDRVHRFDPRGTRLRVTDRAERGAGKFGYLIAACRTRGDTVLVFDSASNDVGGRTAGRGSPCTHSSVSGRGAGDRHRRTGRLAHRCSERWEAR